jgi:cyanophycin synthetase
VANVARGGTIEDCTARVHPDVRAMAEAIARTVRMDSLGIDFITPDIGCSWREVSCAVIEINQTPSLFTEAHVEAILERHFPAGNDGRIPTVLLVEANPTLVEMVAGWLTAAGCCTGCTTPHATLLAGAVRCAPVTRLADRVEALVADPACQALVVAMPAAEIDFDGPPLDRFDLCLRPATLSAVGGLRVATACREVVEAAANRGLDAAAVQAALGRVLARYARASIWPKLH